MLTPEIVARMEKIQRLTDSSNPGEAAAAAARLAEMQAKYFPPEVVASLRINRATSELEKKGYAVWELDGGWYVTPADDLGKVIATGAVDAALIALVDQLPDLAGADA